MKKMLGKARQTMQQYWKNLMSSKRVRMPNGAQFISKMIAWARGENWRGKRENKK
jgi:hypothetical protein